MWRAFDAASRLGDLTYAGLTRNVLIINLLFTGDPLGDVQREAQVGLDFARQFGFGHIIDYMTVNLALIRTLRGLNPEFGSFNGTEFDEGQFEQRLAEAPSLSTAARWYWICQLQARFFAGAYVHALAAASNVRSLLSTPGSLEVAEYHVYAALVRAALCDTASVAERIQHLEALAAHHRQLQEWAGNCPANFEGCAGLIGAEIARSEGRTLDAEQLYEQAIRSARANGFVHIEAIANELAARFYGARGFDTISHVYLRNARYGYVRWGADGKVRQLDQLYPHLREAEPVPGPTSTIGTPVEHLDLATIIKVSQAVSGEIVLEKLLDTLMRTAIEHAGAERGLLILPRGVERRIEAEATTRGDTVIVHLREPTVAAAPLPASIVQYVVRTQESVILDDAAAQNPFSADPYIREHHARSILCVPLINRGTLIGVLYLENNLTPGVFTPTRIAVLKLLASQAAISLENTRLYGDLQQREAKIRRLVDSDIIGICIWNLEGEIIEANDAFLHMVGYGRDDLVSGRVRWTELTPPEWRDADERAVAELKAIGTVRPFEKEYLRNDGSRVPVLIGCATFEGMRDEGVAFVLDLTERKRAEAARQRAEAELQQARTALAHRQRVSMLGELAASLAHEIRQPIAALTIDATACLRALADHRVDVPEARRAASRIVEEATWADEIMSRTSALYRKDTTQRERVDVNGVIRDMAVLLQQEAVASSVSIRTELADGLPDVIADRVQLQQVLMNLMLNAIEAMKDTGGELTITSEKREPGELLISVSDKGVGLPMDTPGTMFDAFVTTKPQGTGMGLAITRSIVDAHGGRLWASANTGPGATFFFTLAAAEAEAPQSQAL